MSNKTQLQTNNAALDSYIARINAAKDTAASLPEAGGGSGATFETSVVTLNAPIFCQYLGIDFQPKTETTSTFETIKNSIVCVSKPPVAGFGYTLLVASGSVGAGNVAVQLTETEVNIIVSVSGGGGGAD